mgnify:CR=1 FL=1
MIATRCPECGTLFRVTAEQLRARSGRVRCGRCRTAFNALDHLDELPPRRSPTPASREPAPGEALPVALAPEVQLAEEASPAPPPATEAGLGDAIDTPTLPMGSEPSASAAPEPGPAIAARIETPRRSALRVWLWALICLLLLLLLLVQIAYLFRSEIAVAYPSSKSWLAQGCQWIGCAVGLPRKPDLLSVDASELHPQPGRKDRLILGATLKNRAPFTVEFPHLELTLTDVADKPIARRILAPAVYLRDTSGIDAGLAANAELQVSLVLDIGGLPAAGYRLYVFYP